MNAATRTSRFPALQFPDYRRFLLGSFISNVGNMAQTVAVALHVYTLTGDSFLVGMLGLVRVVPLLLFSLFGGLVADHSDRRKVLLLSQGLMALVAAGFLAIELAGITQLWMIYALIALFSVARAFDGPSRMAMVPNLVDVHALPNAIGLNGMSWRLSDVLGPLIVSAVAFTGGIPAAGVFGTCYGFNLLTFIAVYWALWKMPPRPPVGQLADRPKNFREVISSIREGLAFVHKTPVLRHALWVDFWATFFSAADALLPALATTVLGAGKEGLGLLTASIGVGALAGAGFMTYRPTVRHQGRWVVTMIFLYGVFTVGVGFAPTMWFAMLCLAGTGFTDMVSTVLRQTIRQMSTPDAMRGRMSATTTVFTVSGPQLGDFEAGAVARLTGERWAIAIGGLLSMVVAGHWSRAKALRDYEHQPASRAEA